MPNLSMPSMPNMPNISMPNLPKIPGVPTQQPKSSFSTRYVFVALGVMLVLTAALWPGLLSGLWKQASGMMGQSAQNDPLTSSEL